MFDNLNWWEFIGLLMLALLIFGDRLPKVIGDGLRMLRNLRSMARDATTDLSRELGTDIQLEDLHPKTFIRKHLLSEAEEEALRKPLQGMYDDIRTDLKGVQSDLKGVQSEFKDVADGISARPGFGRSASDERGPDATPVPQASHDTYDDAT